MTRTAAHLAPRTFHRCVGEILLLLLMRACCVWGAEPVPIETVRPSLQLTSIVQIVSLPPESFSTNRWSAQVTGTVSFIFPGSTRLYIQDRTNAVYVELARAARGLAPGDLVAVVGDLTQYPLQPHFVEASAVRLQSGTVPEAAPATLQELSSGKRPYRRVTTRCVVRDLTSNGKTVYMLVSAEGTVFQAWFHQAGDWFPRDWIDSVIEVDGICHPSLYGASPRPVGFTIHTTDATQARLITPGPGSLFDRKLLTLAEAAAQPQAWEPRYRVRGTVIYSRPNLFYIHDGRDSMIIIPLGLLPTRLQVSTLDHPPQTQPTPGDEIEVIATRHNWFSLVPTMIFAEYKTLGKGQLPSPIPVSMGDLKSGRHAGKVVSIRGKLLNERGWGLPGSLNEAMTFQSGDDIFNASWTSESSVKWKLRPDAYYQVTGVHESEGGIIKGRPTYQILLRNPSDLIPIPAPHFWELPQFWKPAAAAGLVGVIAAGWILTQRWQLRRMNARIQDRTAALETVNRALNTEIQQRKAVEEDLRASEARKAAVLDSALDSIITIDMAGRIMDFNPAAESAFGYSKAEVLGRDMLPTLLPRSTLWAPCEDGHALYALRWDEVIGKRIELMATRRSGQTFPVELGLSRCVAGPTILFTAHIQDISERHRADAERERAIAQERELGELKSRFVSMVSHEFRTPLAIINSSAEILDAYLDRLTPEERKANLHDITSATRHMSSMLEEVLLLGRVEAGKMFFRPTQMDLSGFCQRLVDEVASSTHRRCPIQYTGSQSSVAMADESLLRHILINLVNNACKYSPAGSPVDLIVEQTSSTAHFTVRDRGIGIPAADAKLLFQAFHRGRNVGETPGTGLGMTIVKRCVELHRGQISFTSKEGEGTTFQVEIPLNLPLPPNDSTPTTALL